MKQQVIKISRTLQDNMGNEYKEGFVLVQHMMKPRQNQQQQQFRHDSLQMVLSGCDFIVPTRCHLSVEDIGTEKAFIPFVETIGKKGRVAIPEIAVTIPEGQEFSEANLMAATVAAFENAFADGGGESIMPGVVGLVEL
jgi:hypothetical protein